LEALRPALRSGMLVVGLEPSCISVFRDELPNLFPGDADAARLKQQSFLLGEFLLHHARGWKAPRLEQKAVVHGHCHQRAVLDMNSDVQLLRDLGLEVELLDSGCCGMAGAFGYERQHYAVSIACAERVLLPRVRSAPDDALLIADGFSCRTQIAQGSQRRALHTAEVLQRALRCDAARREAK
jgi:Fe-S oxidoreductase